MIGEYWLKIRATVLVVFIIVFFVALTIALILFAQGKRITPDGRVIDTGVLKIENVPDDANVFVNGKKVNLRGNRVEGVLPGNLEISVELEDFTSWTTTIEVDDKEVKTLYAHLYPLEPDYKKVSELPINGVVLSPDSSHILFVVLDAEDSEKNGLWKYKYRTNVLEIINNPKPEKIASFSQEEARCLEQSSYEFSVSPDNEKLLLICKDSELIRMFDLDNAKVHADLYPLIGYIPDSITWLDESSSLLIHDKNVLYELDLRSQRKYQIYYHTSLPPIFTQSNETVFFLGHQQQSILAYKNHEITEFYNPTELADDTDQIEYTYPEIPSEMKSLFVRNEEDDILVIDTENELMYLNLTEEIFETKTGDYSVIDVSATGEEVLFKDNNDDRFIILLSKHTILAERILLRYIELSEYNIEETALEEFQFTEHESILINTHASGTNTKDVYFVDLNGENSNRMLSDVSLLSNFILVDKDMENTFFVADLDQTGQLFLYTAALVK